MTHKIDPNWLPEGKHWGLQIAHRRSRARSGLTQLPGAPKVILHTFECPISRGANAMHEYLESSGNVAHITFNPRAGTVVQALPFNVGSYVLRNAAGGAETNRAGKVVQIECSGYARNYDDLRESDLKNFGALLELINHRIKMGRSTPLPFKQGSRRLGASEYKDAKGIFGHMHVPENDHWDPGAIDIDKVVEYMRQF